MNLYIKWRYPDETKTHERTFYDVIAETIRIEDGGLLFRREGDDSSCRYPLTHIVEMRPVAEDHVILEVGFDVGDGIFSVNMVEGGNNTAEKWVQAHAKKYGYRVAYLLQIDSIAAESNKSKGMPHIRV